MSPEQGRAVTAVVASSLREGCAIRLKVWGRSMLPLIWPGASLTFEPVELADVRVGDVVLVEGAVLQAHRVVERDEESIVTRGDHCRGDDAPARAERVLGRAAGLTLGRWTLPLPARIAHPATRALGRPSRWVAARLPAMRRWASALHGPSIRALRARWAPWRVEPLDASSIEAVLLRRGRHPTAANLGRVRRSVDDATAFVAIRGGRTVGCVVVDGADHGAVDLWVDPAARGLGIARALLTAAVDAARRAEIAELRLARAWPEARWMRDPPLGFELVGPEGGRPDRVILAKRL